VSGIMQRIIESRRVRGADQARRTAMSAYILAWLASGLTLTWQAVAEGPARLIGAAMVLLAVHLIVKYAVRKRATRRAGKQSPAPPPGPSTIGDTRGTPGDVPDTDLLPCYFSKYELQRLTALRLRYREHLTVLDQPPAS
jgi:hypothetical protein